MEYYSALKNENFNYVDCPTLSFSHSVPKEHLEFYIDIINWLA